jgi:hypothetical protein
LTTENVPEQKDYSNVTENFVWIELPEPDNFLKVKETLTRIGVASASSTKKELFQSCHILHKQGKYALVHFKEMFLLDGKPTNFSEDDLARRNAIANLLAQWGLIKIVEPEKTKEPVCPLGKIKVISYKEKKDWTLTAKYTIGKSKQVTTQ